MLRKAAQFKAGQVCFMASLRMNENYEFESTVERLVVLGKHKEKGTEYRKGGENLVTLKDGGWCNPSFYVEFISKERKALEIYKNLRISRFFKTEREANRWIEQFVFEYKAFRRNPKNYDAVYDLEWCCDWQKDYERRFMEGWRL